MAAKYMIQQVEKVVAEAEFLKDLIQSAFIPQLMGVYESPLQCILVTEFLAGGDLVTRTAQDSYRLTERKCQIFLRQVGRRPHPLSSSYTELSSSSDCPRSPVHSQSENHSPRPEAVQHHVLQP